VCVFDSLLWNLCIGCDRILLAEERYEKNLVDEKRYNIYCTRKHEGLNFVAHQHKISGLPFEAQLPDSPEARHCKSA